METLFRKAALPEDVRRLRACTLESGRKREHGIQHEVFTHGIYHSTLAPSGSPHVLNHALRVYNDFA